MVFRVEIRINLSGKEAKKEMKKRKGFTLVEIMIVVAIIALLAAIAIPNLLTARRSANDAAAKSELHTLSTAFENYAIDNDGSYPTTQSDIIPTYIAATPGNMTESASGTKGGYTFTWNTHTSSAYNVTAEATTCGTSGNKDYTLTTGGQIAEADCE